MTTSEIIGGGTRPPRVVFVVRDRSGQAEHTMNKEYNIEKDKIFFGTSGLTSTSANYVANKAKEMYMSLSTQLSKITFYNTTVKLLGTNEESLLREGLTSVSEMKDAMECIANLKSLIAWLREAIKAKERMADAVGQYGYEHYGIVVPVRPERAEAMTEDDYIATLNIKQRNRYYYLEAVCATIGTFIHPDGPYAVARKELAEVAVEPHKVDGKGRDTLLYTFTPSIAPDVVEDEFMKLQSLHRSYQAEFNSIKHEIEEAVRKDASDKQIEYSAACGKYAAELEVADSLLAESKKAQLAEIGAYKIVIPDALKSVYEMVEKTGK